MKQNYAVVVRQSIVILIVISVAFPIGGVGTGSAQQQINISPDFPDRPTAGERTSVSVSIDAPDVTPFGSISTDAEINLYVDDTQVNSKSITIGDGEVISSEIGHTFQQSGSKDVRIEVVGSLRNLDFSPSVSRTIDIQPAEISIDGDLDLVLTNPPSDTEIDETVGIDARTTVPDFGETDRAQLFASLLIDGEQVSKKSLSEITPENRRDVSFDPAFESTGQKNVTLKVTLQLTLAGQERTLTVSKSRSVNAFKTVNGAMFTTPDSLQEEVTRYREELSEEALSDLPPEIRGSIEITSRLVQNRSNNSVLATENRIYIVLGKQEMDIERVSVSGFVLDKELTDNLTFGVIAATEISDVPPRPVSLQNVTTNSDEYQLDSVQINSHYRRISLRYDRDEAGFAETKANVGVLTNDPITRSNLFSNLGSRTEAIVSDTQAGEQDESTTLRPIDDARSPYLRTVSFNAEEQFWIDAPAEVSGLILRSDSPAVNFLQQYHPSQVEYLKDERQILYVTETNLSPRKISDIQQINSRADSLNHKVIQTEVNLAEGVISTQENIEHYSGGGPERLQIPIPNGPIVVDVIADTAVHTGIGWNAQPRSRDDIIFIIGASSTTIDKSLSEQKNEALSQANISQGNISQANASGVVSLLQNKTGRYRITGEVIPTSQVADSLPEGAVFLVYDIEELNEIIPPIEEFRGLIQTEFGTLRSNINNQLDTEKTDIAPTTKTGSVAQITRSSTSEVTLSGIRSGSVSAQRLTLNTTTVVQDVTATVSQPATTPDSIPNPPSGVLDILNISTSIADSKVQQSEIQFQVYNTAVPADRELIVYRYDGNSWAPLSTDTIGTTDTTTTITSTASEFSYFAVGHTDRNLTPDPDPVPPDTPENKTSPTVSRSLSSSEVAPNETVTLTTEVTGVNGSVSIASSYDPQVSSATVQSITVNGESVNPMISSASDGGSTVGLGDIGTDATVTITEELTVGEEISVTHNITGAVSLGETDAVTELEPVSVTVTDTNTDQQSNDVIRTVSANEVTPGETVTLTTEITGASGSVSTSSSYTPQLSSATVQSVTVDGESVNPIISQATVNGGTVTLGDIGTDATVTITEELTVGEELNVTHTITGDVTVGETDAVTELEPVSVTVADTESQSVVDEFDADGNGDISIIELGQAGQAFASGELSITELGQIGAAFAS